MRPRVIHAIEEFEAPAKEDYEGRYHESRQIVSDGEEGKIIRLHSDFMFQVHDTLASVSTGDVGWEDAYDIILSATTDMLEREDFEFHQYKRIDGKITRTGTSKLARQ